MLNYNHTPVHLMAPNGPSHSLPSLQAALVWPPGGEGSHNKGAGVAGGVGGSSPPTSQQAAPQGLVHWMSVMAEHMNNPHHDAVHYMWNGVEVSTHQTRVLSYLFINLVFFCSRSFVNMRFSLGRPTLEV